MSKTACPVQLASAGQDEAREQGGKSRGVEDHPVSREAANHRWWRVRSRLLATGSSEDEIEEANEGINEQTKNHPAQPLRASSQCDLPKVSFRNAVCELVGGYNRRKPDDKDADMQSPDISATWHSDSEPAENMSDGAQEPSKASECHECNCDDSHGALSGLGERLAHPRRGGKPEFKQERYSPLDEASC